MNSSADRLAVVPHFKDQFLRLVAHREPDRASGAAVRQSVPQQIGRHLLESADVTAHGAVDINVAEDAALRLSVLKLSDDRGERRFEIVDLLQLHADASAKSGSCEIENIIDQGGHPAAVDLDARGDAEEGGVARLPLQYLRARKHGMQRVAQVVAENRDELLAQFTGRPFIEQCSVFLRSCLVAIELQRDEPAKRVNIETMRASATFAGFRSMAHTIAEISAHRP